MKILPAWSFCENDVIRMLAINSFNEFDAGEIFPMSHGLFEESFVCSREISINLVRYNAMIPDAFFPGCRSSTMSTRCRMSRSSAIMIHEILGFVLVVKFNRPETSIMKRYNLFRRICRVPRKRSLPTFRWRLSSPGNSKKKKEKRKFTSGPRKTISIDYFIGICTLIFSKSIFLRSSVKGDCFNEIWVTKKNAENVRWFGN